jgi:hypothetical protein
MARSPFLSAASNREELSDDNGDYVFTARLQVFGLRLAGERAYA